MIFPLDLILYKFYIFKKTSQIFNIFIKSYEIYMYELFYDFIFRFTNSFLGGLGSVGLVDALGNSNNRKLSIAIHSTYLTGGSKLYSSSEETE